MKKKIIISTISFCLILICYLIYSNYKSSGSILNTCGESCKIKNAKEVVTRFANELEIENYDKVNELYPNFSGIGEFWIPRDFEITNSHYDGDGITTIFATIQNSRRKIKFKVKQKNSDVTIIDSKGLSSFYSSNIFTYCKNKGYFSSDVIESDIEISRICKERKPQFTNLVNSCAKHVLNNVNLVKDQSNLTIQSIGSYISGRMLVKNNTGFSLNNFDTRFNLMFYDRNGNLLDRADMTLFNIGAFDEKAYEVIYETIPRGTKKYGVQATIIDFDAFAKQVAKDIRYAETISNPFRLDGFID